MKPVRKRERERVWTCERRKYREKIVTRERERESLVERRDGRGRPKSRKIWRAIMCPVNRFRDRPGEQKAGRGFGSSINSRRNPNGVFMQEEESRRSFTGTFRPRDFQSIFQRSAIIQPLIRGRSSLYISWCLCESLFTRDAHTHIIVEWRKEEKEREKDSSEEQNVQEDNKGKISDKIETEEIADWVSFV